MKPRRRLILGLASAGAAIPVARAARAGEPARRIAIHLDEAEPQRMNLVLNNVRNLYAYYRERGQDIRVRIVTYGPGLHLLRTDTSPVKDRVAAMSLELPGLTFAACENTREGMAKSEGKEIPLLGEAEVVPSGVVELMELQGQGWAYLRP